MLCIPMVFYEIKQNTQHNHNEALKFLTKSHSRATASNSIIYIGEQSNINKAEGKIFLSFYWTSGLLDNWVNETDLIKMGLF